MSHGLLRAVVAVLAGLFLSTLVAPWGWLHLHWIAYLPIFWVLRADTPRANRWLVLLYGTAAEAAIFSWISDTITLFSNIPGPVALAILVLFSVVFGLPYFFVFTLLHPMRKRLGAWWIVALPAWLVVVEHLTAQVILFPYQQGISQYRFAYTWQLASVTGVAGLSFLVLFFNAAFGEWIYRRREGRAAPWPWMGAALGTLAGVLAFGVWRYHAIEAVLEEAPRVRVLQLQSSTDMIWRMSRPASASYKLWRDATADTEPGSVDLVVWPEGASPYQLNRSVNANAEMWGLVQQGDFDLVVGAGTREREPLPLDEGDEVRMFNSVYVYSREARAIDPDVPSAAETFEALAGSGCDAETAAPTPVDALVLRWFGEAGGGDASCVQALKDRELALRQGEGGFTASETFARLLASDDEAWRRYRTLTARFAEPPGQRDFRSRAGVHDWVVHEGACLSNDCAYVMVRCRDGRGCDVFPSAPHYDKMVPLPFGEYLPGAELFPWLADLIEGPGNFRAGTTPVVFEAGGARFGTPICYEGILSGVCRQFDDANLIVNVTNDAWFGDTAASDLHGMLVASRAMELGVPVFRSAYSGVSFVTEPHGDILYETELYTQVDRPVEVRMATFDTLYRRLPDWFVWVCALGLAGAWLSTRGRDPEPA